MFKNITEKLLIGTLTLSIMLVGVVLVPGWAEAKGDNGLHLGTEVKLHNNANMGFVSGGNHFDFGMKANVLGKGDNSVKEIIKPAQKTFKEAVKDARGDYKDARKTAQVELKASVNADTSKADRITAIKAYFSKVLVALKAKNLAIETALQAFINTNFSI